MKIFLQDNPFYISVFGGMFVWLLVFLITPVSIVYPLENETIYFIALNIVALVLGYIILPKKEKQILNTKTYFSNQFLWLIIIIVIVSFILRYYDLIVNKGLRVLNPINLNKKLAESFSSNFFYILFSILKQLFFIPLIIYLNGVKKNKMLLYISLSLFLLPLLEGYIRGSRNIFFFSFIFLTLILVYFNLLKLNKKQFSSYIISVIILFVLATNLVMKREGEEKSINVKVLISDAIYSEFLKTNTKVANYISEIKNPSLQKLAISGLQFGQYYTHGIFEFDDVVKHYQKNELKIQKGKYIFSTIARFTNKYKLTNINQDKVAEMHPRGFTFITLFGGLFLDFGWFSILVMFFYGMLQKHIQNNVNIGKSEYTPLLLLFLFFNFFMFTFNFIKGGGTYNIIVSFFVILAFKLTKTIKTTI